MPGGAPSVPAALRKHTTPVYNKLSAAATAGAAAAPPLALELPSMLRHVNFSSGASAYTPSQLLEVRALSEFRMAQQLSVRHTGLHGAITQCN
jgi:hypothetical protein